MRLGWLNGVHLDEDGLTFIDGDDNSVPAHCTSPMLTCWRKLHVEVDSMGKEFDTSSSTALTDTVLTDNTKTWEENQFHSYSEDWDLNPNTGQGQWFDVAANTATQITASGGSQMLSVAQSGDPYRVEFTGFDADDSLRGEIPGPNTADLEAAFEEAYLKVLFDTGKDQSDCPWHYTFDFNTSDWLTYLWDYRGTAPKPNREETAGYWTAYIMSVYDPPDVVKDNDPNGEHAGVGLTHTHEPDYSSVFEETLRDVKLQHGWSDAEYQHARAGVVVHEIGHQFGLPEDTEGDFDNIMRQPQNDDEEDDLKDRTNRFQPSDIKRLRENQSNP